ncbi:MAG: biosis protein MshP [Burkholderiales bacterium]
MKMNQNPSRRLRRQQGFTMVSAIFLLVVLAGLGVAIANISVMQNTSSSLDLQGTRAYQAARAGIEWGLHRELVAAPGACAGTTSSFVLPAPSLNAFTVTVTCNSTVFADADPAIVVRRMRAVACNQPTAGSCVAGTGQNNPNFVQRDLQVTF